LEAGALKAAHDHFIHAAQEAGRANDDQLLVEALIDEAHSTVGLGHPNDSLGLLDAAQAITLRGGVAPSDAIALARGAALHDAGRNPEAIAVLKPLVAAAEARAARDPRQKIALSITLARLGEVMLAVEDFDGARALYARCVALDEASFGTTHPEVAKSLADLAISEYHLDRFAESRAHLARAHQIIVASYGEHNFLAGKLYIAEGSLAAREQQFALGIASYEAAARTLAGTLAPDHPIFVTIEEGLGELLRDEDKCAEAVPHIEKVLRLLERSGTDPKHHALELIEYGACLVYSDRLDDGVTALHQALAEMQENQLPVHWSAEPKAILAEVEWEHHHKAAAIALLREAIAASAGKDTGEFRTMHAAEEARLAEMMK
ncbi:MAG: tetratricopeptide repeat protein, partial [Kofleriaceae bacterium]